jgi:(p)ppGpp synthase/HD superfamily hydrolase
MTLLEETEHFARIKNSDIAFSKGVVFRLKAIGITDENVLCAAILYKTGAGFEEIFARFGREIATLVTAISKDTSLPRQKQEEQYLKQIQSAPWESTLIKLCEISANLKFIRESEMSKTKKSKMLRVNVHYLNSLKDNISKNREKTPGVERLLEGINETLTGHFRQKPFLY